MRTVIQERGVPEFTNDIDRSGHMELFHIVNDGIDSEAVDALHKELLPEIMRDPDYVIGDSIYHRLKLYDELAPTEVKEAHDKLVAENMGLAHFTLNTYFSGQWDRVERSDIEQEAWLELSVSVWKFNPDKGFAFSTYAVERIRSRVSSRIGDLEGIVRAPVNVREDIDLLRREGFLTGYVDDQQIDAIAKKTSLSAGHIKRALIAHRRFSNLRSIDESHGRKEEYFDHEGMPTTRLIAGDLSEKLKTNEYGEMEELVMHEHVITPALNLALDTLDDQRGRRMASMRVGIFDGEPQTLGQIAEIYGVTEQWISQITIRTYDKLRDLLAPIPLDGGRRPNLAEAIHNFEVSRKRSIPNSSYRNSDVFNSLRREQAKQHALGDYMAQVEGILGDFWGEKVAQQVPRLLTSLGYIPPEAAEPEIIKPRHRVGGGIETTKLPDLREDKIRIYIDSLVSDVASSLMDIEQPTKSEAVVRSWVEYVLKRERGYESNLRKEATEAYDLQ